MLLIILDRILHKIRDDQRQFHLVHSCRDRPDTLIHHFHIPLLCNRPQSAHDQFHQCINIHLGNIQIRRCSVHLHKRKKIRNNLILPLDLLCDIRHKFLIKLNRHIFLTDQGIRQYLHGGDGCSQLMGHIGNEFLSGGIQHLHSAQHPVKSVSDAFSLQAVRYGDRIIGVTLLRLVERLRYLLKRLKQPLRGQDRNQHNSQHHNDLHKQRFPAEYLQGSSDRIGRSAHQHDTADDLLSLCRLRLVIIQRHRLRNGNRHLHITIVLVIPACVLPLDAAHHFLRNDRFILADAVRVLDDPQVIINHQHPSVIETGQLVQLSIDHFGRSVLQIMISYQVICQNPKLRGNIRDLHIDGTLLIILQDRISHTDTGYQPYDKQDQKDS